LKAAFGRSPAAGFRAPTRPQHRRRRGAHRVSLFGGMAGYHYLRRHELDRRLRQRVNDSLGHGTGLPLATDGGKLFAGSYALYSGLTLIVATGLIIAPVLHRIFHHFHLDDDQG
jgi:hypothetical protein